MTFYDRITIFILLLYVALRPFSSGLDTAEPETAFLSILAFLGWTGAICGVLRIPKLILPDKKFGILLLIFAAFALLSLWRADAANWQAAIDLAWIWLADFQVFWALLIVCRQFALTRTVVGVLGASLVMSSLFGVYQRWFALDYLRELLAESSGLAVDESFWARISSTRITGQLSYSNAYANFLVALLPLFAPIYLALRHHEKNDLKDKSAKNHARESSPWRTKIILATIVIITLLSLVYSGSKAGLAVAKIIETITLFYLLTPANRRWWRLGEIAGYAALGTLISGFLAMVAMKIFGSVLWRDSIFALAWSGEIFVLIYVLSCFSARKKIAAAATAFFAAILLVGAATVLLKPALKQEAAKQIGVRGNYWASAIAMIGDRPFRGFGLDNFGSYYAKYKRPAGWETRRVHNVYLQLAVDGGIALSATFIVLWVFFFRKYRRPHRDLILSAKKTSPPFSSSAIVVGVVAFVIVYLFFLTGAFNGMGIEYFASEWSRKKSTTALLINGGVNLLLLPIAWIFTCRWLSRAAMKTDSFLPWLRIGVLALLLHFIFDFHFYQASISALLWILAALALAEDERGLHESVWLRSRTKNFVQCVISALIIGVGIWLWGVGIPRYSASINRYLSDKMNLESSLDIQKTQTQLELLDIALPERPRDSNLWIDRANAQLRLKNLPDAIDSARAAVGANPQAMGAKIFLAMLLEQMPYSDRQEMQNLYRTAIAGYPLKPRYRALYANFLWMNRVADPDLSAGEIARSALTLDAATDDIAEKMSPNEKRLAQEVVAAERRRR